MQYTTHFNLNLPEGTDIVNPLVQSNPNYSAIDAAMFANKQAVIGTASEVVSGTVHAITRANTDSNYFRFTATGNWTVGDSMTVDGSAVSVYMTDGTSPVNGCYVINSEVLAMINGSRVTLIISTASLPATRVILSNNTNVETKIASIDNQIANIEYITDSFTYNGPITADQPILLDNGRNYNNALSITIMRQDNANTHYSGNIYVVSSGALYFNPSITSSGALIVVKVVFPA